MLRIRAFQGLRPTPKLASQVACVPYDVVDRDEAAGLAKGNPHSLLHVDRAEIDLPAEIDPYSAEVYEKARANFQQLQSSGTLIRENERCLYLYEQRMGAHAQTGVVAVCHVEDYENDIIKKHEKTRKDKEDDRTRLINTLSADTGPVFLTYRDSAEIDAAVVTMKKEQPLYDFTAPAGIRHTVWRIAHGGDLVSAFTKVPVAYVADGHHRTASAVRVGREQREKNPDHNGTEDYNWFLAVLFPASQLQILPYNRVVQDLNGLSADELSVKIKALFSVSETNDPKPAQPGEVCMFLAGKWHKLTLTRDEDADPVSRLDVSILQDKVLAPIL